MKVSKETVARNFVREGIDVKWRPARESQTLNKEQRAERHEITGKWRYYSNDYFLSEVDAILDSKKFKVPTHAKGLRFCKQVRVKGHLRTRAEGNLSMCRKPNAKRNRVNPGGSVSVCAGIVNGKLHLWHYLKKGKWNAQVALTHRRILRPAARHHRFSNPPERMVF